MKLMTRFMGMIVGVLFCLSLSAMQVNAEEFNFDVLPLEDNLPLISTSKNISDYSLSDNSIFSTKTVLKNELQRGDSSNSQEITKLNTRDNPDEYGITMSHVTDYLTQSNTYKLYSFDLDEGAYLQASLTVPSRCLCRL